MKIHHHLFLASQCCLLFSIILLPKSATSQQRLEKQNESPTRNVFTISSRTGGVHNIDHDDKSLFAQSSDSTSKSVGDSFQLVSSYNQNLCIGPSSYQMSNDSNLKLVPCDATKNAQKWNVDQIGRIHNAAKAWKCIKKVRARATISGCKQTAAFKFAYDSWDDALLWKKNGFLVFGTNNDGGWNFNDVVIKSRKYTAKFQRWLIDDGTSTRKLDAQSYLNERSLLLSAEYVMFKNLQVNDAGAELCIDSNLMLAVCDESSSDQSWSIDNVGRIHKYGDDTKCIKRELSALVIATCGFEASFKFGFDEFDDTIIWKRNANLVVGTDNDSGDIGTDVVIMQRSSSLSYQQWSVIEASPTPPPVEVTYVGNPCNSAFTSGQCEVCTGDCDSDSDCAGTMRCVKRSAWDISVGSASINVPGCVWSVADDVDCATDTSGSIKCDDDDFCFQPISQPGVVNYVGECGTEGYKCNECEGDCDDDSDCAPGLECFQRSGYEAVPGCSGEGGLRDVYQKDICYKPLPPSPTPPVEYMDSLKINQNGCSSESQCDMCTGPCLTNSDCISPLVCFDRSGSEPVVGCVTGGSGDVSGVNYCYEEPTNGPVTYIPGDLTVNENNGLILSTGLTSRVIAQTGSKVQYGDGGSSTLNFHGAPDAGAVFPVTSGANAGGWIYVSNSESSSSGGVGAITFNSMGEVINYDRILTGTSRNCGGGKTYWGTWVTCEEVSSGQVWEVDPYHNGLGSGRQTVIGGTGGNYESFAYDNRNPNFPTFYVTHDSSNGGMVRFTPNPTVVQAAITTGDYSSVLTTMGQLHYLVLSPDTLGSNVGTFSWTTSRSVGDANASAYYPGSEGIDIRNGFLYFTAKSNRHLFVLDLDNLTYVRSSTVSGAFDGSPDQIKSILGDNPDEDLLYFCEESGDDNGIHARDSDGNYYSIISGPGISSETTGLAFSPDKKRMYVSYQFSPGKIFEIKRTDGYAFGGMRLDIKYHYSS